MYHWCIPHCLLLYTRLIWGHGIWSERFHVNGRHVRHVATRAVPHKFCGAQKNSFQAYNVNKHLASLEVYFAPPNLKTWLRACAILQLSITFLCWQTAAHIETPAKKPIHDILCVVIQPRTVWAKPGKHKQLYNIPCMSFRLACLD